MRYLKTMALLGLLCTLPGWADTTQTWLRIDQPDAALRAALPPAAIDYGHFVWMPAEALPGDIDPARIQRIEQPFHLRVDGRRVDPRDGLPGADRPGRAALTGEPDFHLVQFHGPIRREWLQQLTRQGLEPVQFMAPHFYIVWGRADQLPLPGDLPASPVRFAGVLPPAMRFGAVEDSEHDALSYALAMIYRPAEAAILADLAAAGAGIIGAFAMGRDFSVVELRAGPEQYPALAEIPGVLTLQPMTAEPAARGEMAAQSVVGNFDPDGIIFPGYPDWLADAGGGETGLSGAGVIVGVVDQGIRQTHLDLQDRFAPCQPLQPADPDRPTSCNTEGLTSNAGTHVASAIAGTGASGQIRNGFRRGLGMAPGATLVDQLWTPFVSSAGPGGLLEDGMATVFAEAALSGAVITNHSWGIRTFPQGYDIPTRAVDVLIRDALPDQAGNQSVAAIWAINNGGGDRTIGGQCDPSSLGTPDEAKNLLAVGATRLQAPSGGQLNEVFDLYDGSAHGPACDGRTVPQIVAPGCSTDGAIASGDASHGFRCGTSMAAPVVTGAAALFIEQYRRDNDDATPSPALLRAVLTATAQDLVGNRDADDVVLGHRPDRRQGWGRLDANAVINPPNAVLIDQTEVFTDSGDEPWRLRVAPQDPDQPVRIMLAWTDAPGTALQLGDNRSNPALVNDLDLAVTVDGQRYPGNLFGSDGLSTTGVDFDRLNNLEGVVLGPAQHGWREVEIEVSAFNLAADALSPWAPDQTSPQQDFALVCHNCRTEPDFSLTVDPTPLTICLDADGNGSAEAALQAQALLDFSGTIDLGDITASPADAGVSATASPTDLSPGGSATLTVEADDAGDRADVELLINAAPAAEADAVKQVRVPVRLVGAVAGAALPESPAADQSGVPLLPSFSWSAVEGAGRYRFELATSADFNQASLVVDETVTATDYQLLQRLDGQTTHYWRVTAENDCATGPVSETGVFTTASNTPAQLSVAFEAPTEILESSSALPALTAEVIDIDGRPADGARVELVLEAISGRGRLEGETVRPTVAGSAVFDDLVIRSDFGGQFRIVARIVRDEVLPLPAGFELAGGESLTSRVVGGITRAGVFEGLVFRGEKTGIPQTQASLPFASDLRLDLTGPDGAEFSIGGFDELATADEDWDFQGPGSLDDGTYESTHPDAFAPDMSIVGEWTVRFTHDHRAANPMRWDNVEVVLEKEALLETTGSFTVEGRLIFRDRFQQPAP